MIRPITVREGYRGLRNMGCDRLLSGVLAVLWVICGVELDDGRDGATTGEQQR